MPVNSRPAPQRTAHAAALNDSVDSGRPARGTRADQRGDDAQLARARACGVKTRESGEGIGGALASGNHLHALVSAVLRVAGERGDRLGQHDALLLLEE